MEALFYKSNPWWEESFILNAIQRDIYLNELEGYIDNKDIIFLTGLRRVGKTTLLKGIINLLLHVKKIDPKYIFYISLDLYALEGLSIADIVTEYRKLHKLPNSQMIYLFFDEVTSKKSYQQELKNLYDLGGVKIYASSSSASLLKDSQAFLTGRQRLVEVMPLSFEEYLQFKKIVIKKADVHLVESYFEEYMKDGGMPEYVLTGDISYLSNLIDNIIYKDIIAYHKIKDEQMVKDFFKLLMERSGKQLSLNKMANILGIGVDTARRFQSYFEETYLIYTVERHGKLNERLRHPKKIYAGDVGIRNLITGYRDKGAIFENLVYLKLKHKNPRYVYEQSNEIDFITDDKTLIEVKYHSVLNDNQQKLFDTYPANKRLVVNSVQAFMAL
ncbi:ATP-binding protein [Sulfurospirillum cavolei]|uniref:ATP-binding protein n=1 Tax=Sulfurospirillum cavolei TaxID=366522 RepID=UPI000A8276A4|nr:ATP-binding protein [Sulfurospirillum cavolei]